MKTYSLGGAGPLTIEDQRIIGFGTKWPLLNAIIRGDRRDARIMRAASISRGKRKLPEYGWIDVRGMRHEVRT